MPPTLTAPPPTAPKPAPIAAPPKAPDQPTQPSAPSVNEPSPETYLADDMAELSELDSSNAGVVKRETPPQDAKGKFVKRPEQATEQPKDAPEAEKAPETTTVPEKPVEEEKPTNMRALGKIHDALVKKVNGELQPKLQSLEAKTKEYERTIEQLKSSAPDLKPFQEKLTAIEQENAKLREIVRFTDYRKSPEFTDKYEKPYNEAWAKAVSEVTQLNMVMEDGTSRKATANDLLALANAPLDSLDDLAAQWFPKSSPRVIRHVEKIRDLAEAQDKALEEAKKGAGDYATKQQAETQKQGLVFKQAYDGANTELTTKYPKWFAPDETDPKGNELLKKGYEYADTVFANNATLTPEQRAGRLAVIRAKAANHDRLVSKVKSMSAELADLQSKLAQFEDSEPPEDPNTAAASKKSGAMDWAAQDEAELRKLDRR
jgi:hypothetical protein